MRKAVNATTERPFSEPLDHRGAKSCWSVRPGDAGLLTLKGLQTNPTGGYRGLRDARPSLDDIMNRVRRDADRVFCGKRGGLSLRPSGGNQPDPARVKRVKACFRAGTPERRRSLYLFVVAAAKSWKTPCHAGGFLGSAGDTAFPPTSGIPLTIAITHRAYVWSRVTLETGGELDWENSAAEKQTLVFYMGLNQAATIQKNWIAFRWLQADMPVALVENGTSGEATRRPR